MEKTPYSTTYRIGDSHLDEIESVGPFPGPLSALRHLAHEYGWKIDHHTLTGKHFTGETRNGLKVVGSVYPSASTPHTGASL